MSQQDVAHVRAMQERDSLRREVARLRAAIDAALEAMEANPRSFNADDPVVEKVYDALHKAYIAPDNAWIEEVADAQSAEAK